MHRLRFFVPLVLCLACVSRLGAEEDETPRWQVRIFSVATLTQGHIDHLPPDMGLPHLDGGEEPLFGAQLEEPLLPLGTADDIIEYLTAFVIPARYRSANAFDITLQGEHALVVRATEEVMTLIGAHLATLETRTQTTWVTDVVALEASSQDVLARVDPATGEPKDDKAFATWMSTTPTRARVRTIGFEGQRVNGWDGAQRAVVAGYGAEVAEKAHSLDPVVSVLNSGLVVDIKAQGVGRGDRALLTMIVDWVGEKEMRTLPAGNQANMQSPEFDRVRATSNLVVAPKRWVWIGGGGDVPTVLLARTQRVGTTSSRPVPQKVEWPVFDERVSEPLTNRMHNVKDLGVAPFSTLTTLAYLVPSTHTPPEPPELADPAPYFPAENLPDLFEEMLGPQAFARKGTRVELSQGFLIVRATPKVHQAIESELERIRRSTLWATRTTVHWISLPDALAETVLEGEPILTPEAADALVKREGVRILTTGSLVNPQGTRRAIESGRERTYVADYELEIAKEASVGRAVVQSLFEGFQLDLETALTGSGGKHAHLTYRFQQGKLATPMTTFTTPLGELEVPYLRIIRNCAKACVPLGSTLVASAGRESDTRTRLLLLTPRLDAQGE